MGRRPKDDTLNLDRRSSLKMCDRKKKYKSSEASKLAFAWGQRKYECPLCGHWHLTKAVT